MAADEALAIGNRVEQDLFAFGRHRWLAVHSLFLQQVPLRLEKEAVVILDGVGKKYSAILLAGDLDAVLLAKVGGDRLGE